MQPTPLNTLLTKQCNKPLKKAMLTNEHLLFSYQKDFGKIIHSPTDTVIAPPNINVLQHLLKFANQHHLSVTLRGNGLSQNGQSLAADNNVIIDMQAFKEVGDVEEDSIWVGANNSWHDLTAKTLLHQKIPYVLPYNGNLSVAGVLSAGGVGASSFKHGLVIDNVKALEVVTADGVLQQIDAKSALFHACLGGQGQFAAITKACIKLNKVKPNVRTYILLYLDKKVWQADLKKAQGLADYIEAFCTPTPLGAKLNNNARMPFAHWFYALHLSFHYDTEITDVSRNFSPWQMEQVQNESLDSYLHRHDGRFEAMKASGAWELAHPWYECFVGPEIIDQNLEAVLAILPLFYANIVQCVPIANKHNQSFMMLPPQDKVMALMILNPGIAEAFLPATLATISALDKQLLPTGKRYLSGFLGENINKSYWQQYFNHRYQDWVRCKKHFDPKSIFCSFLFKDAF